MKASPSRSYSLSFLYQSLGVSKQAFHQYTQRAGEREEKVGALCRQVDLLRAEHPGCGLEKLYWMIRPDWPGRDRFVSLLQERGYGLPRKRGNHRTTYSVKSARFTNLVAGRTITGTDQVWQTDITYFWSMGRYYYLTFIIDVYSRRIVGHWTSDNLRAEANRKALSMAFRARKGHDLSRLVHHSDRGSQYVDGRYLSELSEGGVTPDRVSMCTCAQDNAYTERVNGTIKSEYLDHWEIQGEKQLKKAVKQAVDHYNHHRPHRSLPGRASPVAYETWLAQHDEKEHPQWEIKAYAESPADARDIAPVERKGVGTEQGGQGSTGQPPPFG